MSQSGAEMNRQVYLCIYCVILIIQCRLRMERKQQQKMSTNSSQLQGMVTVELPW